MAPGIKMEEKQMNRSRPIFVCLILWACLLFSFTVAVTPAEDYRQAQLPCLTATAGFAACSGADGDIAMAVMRRHDGLADCALPIFLCPERYFVIACGIFGGDCRSVKLLEKPQRFHSEEAEKARIHLYCWYKCILAFSVNIVCSF